MKIIVDKMPKEPKDCTFFHNRNCTILGDMDYRVYCDKDICPLKPITDFHAVEVIYECADGSYTARPIPIRCIS